MAFDFAFNFTRILPGTAGDDTLTGTAKGGVILGFGGDDTVMALGGDDVVDGGAGDDLIYGNDGNDLLLGGADNDVVLGGDGTDVLLAGAGIDLLSGEDAADLLLGGSGLSVVLGGSGGDTVLGGTGVMVAVAGPGADFLRGGTGDELFYGGPGNDIMDTGAGSGIHVGGSGADVFLIGDDIIGNGRADIVVAVDFTPGEDTLVLGPQVLAAIFDPATTIASTPVDLEDVVAFLGEADLPMAALGTTARNLLMADLAEEAFGFLVEIGTAVVDALPTDGTTITLPEGDRIIVVGAPPEAVAGLLPGM